MGMFRSLANACVYPADTTELSHNVICINCEQKTVVNIHHKIVKCKTYHEAELVAACWYTAKTEGLL